MMPTPPCPGLRPHTPPPFHTIASLLQCDQQPHTPSHRYSTIAYSQKNKTDETKNVLGSPLVIEKGIFGSDP